MKYESEQLQGIRADKPLIKNTLLQQMFERIANDAEMAIFVREAKSGATHRATAYASKKIVPIFEALVAERERLTGTYGVEGLKTVVYRKGV